MYFIVIFIINNKIVFRFKVLLATYPQIYKNIIITPIILSKNLNIPQNIINIVK